MSADDFRDLIDEFANEAVVTLRFFRVRGGGARNGIPQPATLTEFTIEGGYVCVPRSPKARFDQIPPDKRERDSLLVWAKQAEASTAILRTVDQVGETTADRVYDVDAGKWYLCDEQWRYGRQARVNGAICKLIDQQPAPPPEPPDPP